jgi:MerR family mercuric resistance operon transcriptional regulator
MSSESENLTIDRVARAAVVNVETIRFDERCGLLIETRRSNGRVWRYGAAELARVRCIRTAQPA